MSGNTDYNARWIQTELDVPTYALSYDIVAQSIYVPRTPAGWRLYGSITGDFSGEEVLLDVRSGETGWVAYEKRSYTITNPGSYKYYRWQISDTEYSQNPGAEYYSSIGLIELYVEAQSRESIATPFEVQGDCLADHIKVLVKRVGFIGDVVYSLAIHEDDGGEPAATAVSGGTISADFSGVSKTSAEWMTLHFDAPIALNRGAKYWLVLSSDQSYASATRCIEWQAGGGNNELIYGNCLAEINGVWTELNNVAVSFEIHRYQVAVDETDVDGAMKLFCTNGTTYEDLAQSFELDNTMDVGGLRLYLKRTSAPSDNMTVEIQADSSDAPSGTPITNATSLPVPMDYLEDEGVYQWIDFSFTSTVSLNASTKYWIVLKSDGAVSSTAYISWATVTESYDAHDPDVCVIDEVFASDVGYNYSPMFACDDDTSTAWRSLVTGSGYLQFNLAASKTANFLSITAKDNTNYAPSGIELLASNTGVFGGEEVSLLSDSVSWTAYETKEWSFSNSTAYAYYRLSMVKSGYTLEVAEVELRNEHSETRGCPSGTMLYYDSSAWVNAGGVDGCFHIVPATTSVEEKMLLGSWSTTKAEVGNRYGDPTGANYDTQTSFVGLENNPMDCVLMVELP